ncbi:hypothetical protein D9619_009408 [Psilocybe cf. subviscida]|uniref:Uncharacterized protein n=1 Tax=Psilocybe cf. subviscida TaxID=2480587 RepID=A0A8H5BU52_9AGAR|nr:hypothetical protein D9619_009408 [Psilocybe cf. subviscida]
MASSSTSFSTMQQGPSSSTSNMNGHYSGASSNHSSPRGYHSELYGSQNNLSSSTNLSSSLSNLSAPHHPQHSQTYPLPAGAAPFPYIPAAQRRAMPGAPPPFASQANFQPGQHYMAQPQSRSQSYSSAYSSSSQGPYGPPSSAYSAPILQVTTSGGSTGSSHDDDGAGEPTARPGNAHVHEQFHRALAGGNLSLHQRNTSTASLPSSLRREAMLGPGSGGDSEENGQAQNGGIPDGNAGVAAQYQTPGFNSQGQYQNRQEGSQQQQSTDQQKQLTQADYASSTPGLANGFSRPLTPAETERLAYLDRLKFFLATAPSRWDSAGADTPASGSTGFGGSGIGGLAADGLPFTPYGPPVAHPALNRFLLPNQEFVTCVLWNGLYHVTGTDIVRALVFRFEAFGRPVRNMKKFEEGVFSDLRNLKPGVDACLEEPKTRESIVPSKQPTVS